jgi:hypothetical protein
MQRRERFGLLLACIIAVPHQSTAASLRPETIAGWNAYVLATEARISRELASANGFLAGDFSPATPLDRRAILGGQFGVMKTTTAGQDGPIDVPEGMVHHWRGIVFIPGASLEEILARVADPRTEDAAQEDVIAARVIDRGPGSLRLFLRLQRSQLVTVVYNTEHAVRYTRRGGTRASSRSVATRIAEVAEPATPYEWERPPGNDRGFLWRLNSYWRYEQVAGGVLVECESISLSRSVPALVRSAAGAVIDQVARGSMERTLAARRARFTRPSSVRE